MAEYDYSTESTKVERQRRLADVLRKLSLDTYATDATDPGRMVSGHYVAPSFAQGLARNVVQPMMQNRAAEQAGAQANQMEGAYNNQINQARQSWQQGLPQTVAGQELPGPRDEMGSPELDVPPQLPDRQSVLRATLAGMQIPGNEKAAGLWNQGMQEEQRREDTQANQRQVLQQTLLARRDAQKQQEQLARDRMLEGSEQAAANRQAKSEEAERQRRFEALMRAQANETRLAVAQMGASNRSGANAAEVRAAATDKRDVEHSLEKLGTRMKPLVPVIGAAQQIQKLIDENTDPASGKVKPIPGLGYEGAIPAPVRSLGATLGLAPESTNVNKAVVSDLVGAIMRNQAGLSQTISEQARVLEKTLSSGTYSQKEFLDNWHNLVRAINDDTKNAIGVARPEALDLYRERVGPVEPIQSKVKSKQDRLNELRAKAAGG